MVVVKIAAIAPLTVSYTEMSLRFAYHLILLLILSPFAVQSQSLKVQVFNKTGYDLNAVSFGPDALGSILKDSAVVMDSIAELILQGDVPLFRPYGILAGRELPAPPKPCSTHARKVQSGNYVWDIRMYASDNGWRLYWQQHQP